MSSGYRARYLRGKEATILHDSTGNYITAARPRHRFKQASFSHGSKDKCVSAQPSPPAEKPSFQRNVEEQAKAIPAMRHNSVKQTAHQRKGNAKSRAVPDAVENNQTRRRREPRRSCQSQLRWEKSVTTVPRGAHGYRPKQDSSEWSDTGVTLSTVLDRTPVLEQCSATTHAFPAKIAAVDKCISEIGKLRTSQCAARTVFLSHNCLQSLHGLSQLARVHTLSLADNLIEDVDELRELRMLTQLRALTLSGNPISFVPYYRAHVLANVDPAALSRSSADRTSLEDITAQLFKLDGIAVCAFEANRAAKLSQRDHSMRRLFVSNDCVMHQLHTCLLLLQLHAELRATVHHRVIQPLPLSFSVGRFIEFWPYEKGVQANEREQRHILRRAHNATRTFFSALWHNSENSPSLKANASILDEETSLMRKAKHVSDTWDSACAEFVATQQSAIANLHGRCEEVVAKSDLAARRRCRPRQRRPLFAQSSGKRQQSKSMASLSPWAVAGPRWRDSDDRDGSSRGDGSRRDGSDSGNCRTRVVGVRGSDNASSYADKGDHAGTRRSADQMKNDKHGYNRLNGSNHEGQRQTTSIHDVNQHAVLSSVPENHQHVRAMHANDKRGDVVARYQKALDCVGEAKPKTASNPKGEEEELLREKAQLLKALQQCNNSVVSPAKCSLTLVQAQNRKVQRSESELEQRHSLTPDHAITQPKNIGQKVFSPSKLPPQLHAPDSPFATVPHSCARSMSNVEDVKQRLRRAAREIHGCEISETLLLRQSESSPRNISELYFLLQSVIPGQLDMNELQELMGAEAHRNSCAEGTDDEFDVVRHFVHICLSPPMGWDSDGHGSAPERTHLHSKTGGRCQHQNTKAQHRNTPTQIQAPRDSGRSTGQDEAEEDKIELTWCNQPVEIIHKHAIRMGVNDNLPVADTRTTAQKLHARWPTKYASLETITELDEIETRLFAHPKASRVFVRMGYHRREQWRNAVVVFSAKCNASRNKVAAENALCGWKGYVARRKFAARARQLRHAELLQRVLDTWCWYARFHQCMSRWLKSNALVVIGSSFDCWRNTVQAIQQESQACASADCLRQRLFLRRLFRTWQSYTNAANLTPAREHELVAWALAHNEWRLKMCVFRSLSRHMDNVVRPRRKAVAVLCLRAEMRTTSRALCRIVLQRWRKVVINSVQRRCEAQRNTALQCEARTRMQHTVARFLTAYFSRYVRARQRHALCAWKGYIVLQLHVDEAVMTSVRIADGLYRRKRQRHIWSLWTKLVRSHRKCRDNEARALEHFFTATFRRNFDLWRRHYRASAMERWRGHRAVLIEAIQHWQRARQNARAREAREHVATAMASRRMATRIRTVIVEWHAYVVESRLRRVALQAAMQTASIGTLRAAIGIWHRCTLYLVRCDSNVWAAKRHEHKKELQLQADSTRTLAHKCESLTADGLLLRDKLHTADVALLEARTELASSDEENRRLLSRAVRAEEAAEALKVEHKAAERRCAQQMATMRRDIERMSTQLHESQASEKGMRARLESELGREKAAALKASADAAQAHRKADAAARKATVLQEEHKIENENMAREFHSAIAQEQQRVQLAENARATSEDTLKMKQAEFDTLLHEWRERALQAERDAQRMEAALAETCAEKLTLEKEFGQQQSWGREISAMLAEKDTQLATLGAQMRQQVAALGVADNANVPMTSSAADVRAMDLLQRLRGQSYNETTLPVATARNITQSSTFGGLRSQSHSESRLDRLEEKLVARLSSRVPTL